MENPFCFYNLDPFRMFYINQVESKMIELYDNDHSDAEIVETLNKLFADKIGEIRTNDNDCWDETNYWIFKTSEKPELVYKHRLSQTNDEYLPIDDILSSERLFKEVFVKNAA